VQRFSLIYSEFGWKSNKAQILACVVQMRSE